MKSFIVQASLIFFVFTLSGTVYPESGKCIRLTAETISRHIPVSDFKILSSREIQGLCEIMISVNSRVIPLYGDENFIISGDLYDNKINFTRKYLYELNKKIFLENKASLDKVVAFEYIPAVAKPDKTIYMFTEPLCPYCHKSGSEVKKLSDKYGFTVKIILVTMKGDEGKRKCIEAACRHFVLKDKFNLEQYNQIEWKKEKTADEFICEKGTALINQAEEISKILNVDGIPLFYTNTGDSVSGADMEALELLVK